MHTLGESNLQRLWLAEALLFTSGRVYPNFPGVDGVDGVGEVWDWPKRKVR